jgi:Cu/Ag efflux protein CusF
MPSLRAGLERARREGRLTESTPAKPKHTKYGNVKTRGFDSRKEARRFDELAALERGGAITDLKRQVRYRIEINGVHVCDYIADLVYRVDGKLVVEDVKSEATRKHRAYRIKYKLMQSVFNIQIQEV